MRKRVLRGSLVVIALLLLCSLWRGVHADTAPLREREVWNTAVTTGSNILGTSLTPSTRGSVVANPATRCTTYRVSYAVAPAGASSTLILYVTNTAAAESLSFTLNSGTALQPGQLFSFAFTASDTFTYNFRVGTNTTVGYLQVDRIEDGGF